MANDVYRGRKPVIDRAKVRKLQAAGLGPTEIAQKLGIGRASVYRVVGQASRDGASIQANIGGERLQSRCN